MTPRAALLLIPLLTAPPAAAQTVKGAPAPTPSPAPALTPTGPALPPGLVPCTRLEGATADPNAREAERTRALLRDGRVATIILDLPGGRATRTDLSPGRRDGTSVRLVAFPRPAAPHTPPVGAWNTAFNLATVEPDGKILVETWLAYTDRPSAPPVHNWYRLRCEDGAAPPPGPPSGPRPGAKG